MRPGKDVYTPNPALLGSKLLHHHCSSALLFSLILVCSIPCVEDFLDGILGESLAQRQESDMSSTRVNSHPPRWERDPQTECAVKNSDFGGPLDCTEQPILRFLGRYSAFWSVSLYLNCYGHIVVTWPEDYLPASKLAKYAPAAETWTYVTPSSLLPAEPSPPSVLHSASCTPHNTLSSAHSYPPLSE